MPAYIGLYRLTDQRVKNIKDAPARLDAAFKGAGKMGGKTLGLYVVMGKND